MGVRLNHCWAVEPLDLRLQPGAHEVGFSYLLLEGERFANVIQNFTKGKPLIELPRTWALVFWDHLCLMQSLL